MAGLPFAAVDLMAFLIASFAAIRAFEIAEGRAAGCDCCLQNLANAAGQGLYFLWRDLIGPQQRVNAGAMQGLVAVDVSQAADGVLIHEQGLDLPPTGEYLLQDRHADGEGVWAERTERIGTCVGARIQEPDSAEAARITEAEFAAGVREAQPQVRMFGRRDLALLDGYAPGHAEVDDEAGAVIQPEREALALSLDTDEASAGEGVLNGPSTRTNEVGAMEGDRLDSRTLHRGLQLRCDGLDFG